MHKVAQVFSMMRSFILVALLGGGSAFHVARTHGYVSKSAGVRRVASSSTQVGQSSGDEFAKVDDDTGAPSVDLDALSRESAAKTFTPSIDISDMLVKGKREAPRQAEWLPMLLSPEALDGSMAGDVGFDPLGFAKDKASLQRMREAEIKHARLAMLGAAGWPLSELWHREIADNLGLDSILSTNDRAPSVLNGGLSNEWIIGAAVFSLALGGLLETKAFDAKSKTNYKPGDYGFDPIGFYSIRSSFQLDKIAETLTREEKIARAKFDMELCEIKNGRLAMLAITADAAQEFISGIPIVQQVPFFFGDPMI